MQSSISRRTFAALTGGALWLASSGALADHHGFHENRYLLVSASGDAASDTQLALAEAALAQAGVAYDKYVATENGAPKAQALPLTDLTGKPSYTGVVLATGQVLFQNAGGQWLSGLTQTQWAQLDDYEKQYDVRRVALYSVPGADNGMEYVGASGDAAPLVATSEAATLPGLQALGEQQLSGSWRYIGKPMAEGKAKPLLTYGTDGGAVAAALVDVDGRAQLHFFFSQAPTNEVSTKLAPLWISWLKKDVTTPPPPPPPSDDRFGGSWSLRFPDFGESFDGTLAISAAVTGSDERQMKWSVGAHDYVGLGIQDEKTLLAGWSKSGDVHLVRYAVSNVGYGGPYVKNGTTTERGDEEIVGLQPNTISGTFNVRGRSEAGNFLGVVYVQRHQNVYMLQRQVNGQSVNGIGRLVGDELVVVYSADPVFGVVIYEQSAQDGLTGTWLRHGYDQTFAQVLSRVL